MNENPPKITVLMPVYNGEKYLRVAIKSILNQTFQNFEFLIILEPSTDRSEEIINSFKDPRIRFVKNNKKLGLSLVLNQGLDLAKGEYVARMDSDDIYIPQRLTQQVDFMDHHNEVGLCGTWASIIYQNSRSRGLLERLSRSLLKYLGYLRKQQIRTPITFEQIKIMSLFSNPFVHSSVIIRRSLLQKYQLRYDTAQKNSEDYELWTRIFNNFECRNLGEILMIYRVHPTQFNYVKSTEQKLSFIKIQEKLLKQLGIDPSKSDLQIHGAISFSEPQNDQNIILQAERWLYRLHQKNAKAHLYPEPQFSRTLAERWANFCSGATCPRFKLWGIFWNSALSPKLYLDWKRKLLYVLRWLSKFPIIRKIRPNMFI